MQNMQNRSKQSKPESVVPLAMFTYVIFLELWRRSGMLAPSLSDNLWQFTGRWNGFRAAPYLNLYFRVDFAMFGYSPEKYLNIT